MVAARITWQTLGIYPKASPAQRPVTLGQVVIAGLTWPKEVDMRYKVTFLAGFSAGFVVGARAGRERYEQLMKLARQTADHPAVQQAAAAVQAKATGLASTATHKVAGQFHDGIASAREKVPGMRGRESNGHDGGKHHFASAHDARDSAHGAGSPSADA